MKTDDLIVELARAVRPVRRLPSPSIRLLRWIALTAPLMLLAVVIIPSRRDVMTSMSQAAFMGLALVTLVTALLAAAAALILSIPGAERSRWQRALPLLAGGAWIAALAYSLALEGAAIERLLRLPIHAACIAEIAGLSLIPGWALFKMVRGAAPLQQEWSGALAALAAVAFAAVATQFICPVDDAAHQLAGHVAPVAVFATLGILIGQRYLAWRS